MSAAPSTAAGTVGRLAGMGTVTEPGLTGIGSTPMRFPATGQPVSVCHQRSMTGMPSWS